MLEFSLVGIPAIFLLISIAEISRGMWSYHGMARAVNKGVRLAMVRGKGCVTNGNACPVTVGDIAREVANAAIGVPAGELNITLVTDSGQIESCQPVSTCFSNGSVWPPATNNDNAPGKSVTIRGLYRFASAIAMFWPGTGGVEFGTVTFPASATQRIVY